MPKPLLLRRPSGLYVRFLVPVALRDAVGSRFLVRSLGNRRGDAARLEAARLGYALAIQFAGMKQHMAGETKKDNPRPPRPVVLRTTPLGPSFGVVDYVCQVEANGAARIEADSPEDHARAMEALQLMQRSAPAAVPAVSAKPSPMLGERIDLFMKQFRQKQRAPANVLDTEYALRLFLGLVGDRPLVEVDAEAMDIFLDAINHWPPNASKKPAYKGLTPAQVVKKAKKLGEPTISARTQEKHLDRLRVFFNWCLARRDMDRNPAASLHVMTREQEETRERRAFTTDELATLFDPVRRAEHCATPVRWWLPLLALYTGARAQELAQLRTDEVEEVAGIWGFHIWALHPSQKIKNRVSKRFVPIHPALLAAGLLDYRADVVSTLGAGPLFPGLGARAGDSLGDWFNRTYLRGACKITDPGLVFHCFRHTFATVADRLGIPESRIARITGHSTGGSILRAHYIDAPTLPDRAAAMRAVVFDLPAVPPYQPGQFASFFAKATRSTRRRTAVKKRATRSSKTPLPD
jgi:Integrase